MWILPIENGKLLIRALPTVHQTYDPQKFNASEIKNKKVFQAIKQVSVNLQEFKSYKVCSVSTMELNYNNKKIHMEISPNIFILNDTVLNNPWVK